MDDHHRRTVHRATIGVLTVSDTRDRGNDRSGDCIRQLLTDAGHRIHAAAIVPDEPDLVRQQVVDWLSDEPCDVVVTNGGTGVSGRDQTYEALVGLLDKRLDGFGELFRMLSYEEIGSAAMLSRAIGGTVGSKALFALPGSTAAVRLATEKLILPTLGHLLAQLRIRR